jgi:hypothetical protein
VDHSRSSPSPSRSKLRSAAGFFAAPDLTRAALATVIVIAAAVRFVEATRVSLWFDEIYTLWIARLGPAGIVHALRADVHPPLHEWLVWLWWRMGGESAVWLRSLSVIFGVATVAALYGFTRDLFGRAAALLAALLLALHRTHVYYSQELRPYGMLWLLYLLALWAAWRFVRDGRARWGAAYVVVAAAALYTHYQSGLVLGIIALWGVIALIGIPRRLGAWIGLHVAVAVLFLPQLPTFLLQTHRNQELHWVTAPHFADLAHLAQVYAFGYRLLILPALALAAVPLFRSSDRKAAALLWSFMLPLIAISYVLTQRGAHLFTERYMDFALPGWCALLATGAIGLGALLPARRGAAEGRVPASWVSAAAGIALAVLAAKSLKAHQPLEEPRELSLAEHEIEAHAQPGDVVVHADTHSLLFFAQNAPGLGRQRLLVVGTPLPYYEGIAVIADSLILSTDDFARLRASGAHWWGVRTHHSGTDSRTALDTLRAHAASIRHLGPLVTLIEGAIDSTRAR